jgi:serine/threonine protein kinase
MEAVGKLDHPHIVRASDAGEIAGTHFLVMDFVPGVDLAKLVRRRGPLAIADACELARQAAQGLQHVYECGLVHRDVKPSNLLLSTSGIVKVSDLGLARLRNDVQELASPEASDITATGQLLGTVSFMAPEQASNTRGVDIRADIYSLGCTLFMLLTGRPPYDGPEFDSVMSKLVAHASAPVPSMDSIRPEIPAALSALVAQMLAKAPEDRIATPSRVAELLEPFAAGHNVPLLVSGAATNARAVEEAPHPSTADRHVSTIASPAAESSPPLLPAAQPQGRGVAARTRTWVVAGFLLACIGGAGTLFSIQGFFPRPDRKNVQERPSEKDGATPRDPEPSPPRISPVPSRIPSGESENLLGQDPVKLLWPEDPKDGAFHRDAQTGALVVTCGDVGMLALGKTEARDFRLELQIRQHPWTGGIGLFAGCREETVDGQRTLRFLRILLEPHLPQKPGSEFRVTRSLSTVTFVEKGQPRVVQGASQAALVPLPLEPEATLAIEVKKGILVAVEWDGRVVFAHEPGVPDPIFKALEEVDPRGAFGTFNLWSDCVYSAASLLLAEPE